MCGLWRIPLVSCWETLVGRFFGSGKSWSLPALAEKDWFLALLFLGIHGKISCFWQISRVGRETSCLWSLPPHLSKASRHGACLSAWSVGQRPPQVGGRVLRSSTLDTIPNTVLRQRGDTANGQCLCATSQCLLLGTKHPTSSSSPCDQKGCVATSVLYLPALYLNPEVKGFLYLIAIPLSHLSALDESG